MILPNKYVTLTESFIGLSALILDVLNNDKMTVDKLWDSFTKKFISTRKINIIPTYQKYIYVLDFMYLANMISYNAKGEIVNENIKLSN